MNQFVAAVIIGVIAGRCAAQPSTPKGPEAALSDAAVSKALSRATKRATELLVEGKIKEANELIVAAVPEATRTPAQALMLANVLYKHDPKRSYLLHKQAAEALPTSSDAQFEWALEQHRAREYGAALETYQKMIALDPSRAPVYGLAAECSLREKNVDAAVTLWKASEHAKSGTIEDFETLACEVNGPVAHDAERARLRELARGGDVDAALGLVFLDCNWVEDWWNTTSKREYLKNDMALIEHAAPPIPPDTMAEIRCVAACVEAEGDAQKVRDTITGARFFVGEDAKIPASGRMASIIVARAIDADVLSDETLRKRFAVRICELAKPGHDTELWNLAANLSTGDSARLREIDQAAWPATHDVRFAASFVVGGVADRTITLASPELTKARDEFPDSAEIARAVLQLARSEGKPLEPYLISAILAEYRRFSMGGLAPRPKATALRSYFRNLEAVRSPHDAPK